MSARRAGGGGGVGATSSGTGLGHGGGGGGGGGTFALNGTNAVVTFGADAGAGGRNDPDYISGRGLGGAAQTASNAAGSAGAAGYVQIIYQEVA
ncbi:hypothetical protein [Rhodoligotrophos defluvii]|uniref:hypothetical protein n=1 Tax=Rhodoligotrophos defluvii TaxID=2561934 RepID=UPI00196127DB|nr:hypothetical protein [Rhodoligotrophos defluvii]